MDVQPCKILQTSKVQRLCQSMDEVVKQTWLLPLSTPRLDRDPICRSKNRHVFTFVSFIGKGNRSALMPDLQLLEVSLGLLDIFGKATQEIYCPSGICLHLPATYCIGINWLKLKMLAVGVLPILCSQNIMFCYDVLCEDACCSVFSECLRNKAEG